MKVFTGLLVFVGLINSFSSVYSDDMQQAKKNFSNIFLIKEENCWDKQNTIYEKRHKIFLVSADWSDN